MAVVATDITATLSRTVFQKPPDILRERTAIPRAIVNFTALTSIDAKPVNDQQELEVQFPLDSAFAYRLIDFNAWVTQDVANDWNPVAVIQVFNSVKNLPPGNVQRHPVALDMSIRIDPALELWMARFEPGAAPLYVFQQPFGGAQNTIQLEAFNGTAAVGAAGQFGCFVSFYEYEIEQAEYFALHHSLLAHDR